AQDLRQRPGGQLACSAGTGGVIDQALFASEEQHACCLCSRMPGRCTAPAHRPDGLSCQDRGRQLSTAEKRGERAGWRIEARSASAGTSLQARSVSAGTSSQARSASAGTSAASGLLHQALDGVEDPALVGELAGLQLRVDLLAVDRQLETTAPPGDQFQI